MVRILPVLWDLPDGTWRLSLSHWVGGALEPPTPSPTSTWNARSLICDHGGEGPRCSGPGARLAPGGPAEHAAPKTHHEIQWGPRARLPGVQGLRGGEDKNGYFKSETVWHCKSLSEPEEKN